MTKRMLIDATHAEETRVVVLDGNRLEEFDVETSTKKQLKGNIYLAKVVRVEPSLQAAFVEYGGNRHGFLAFGEIHPDYYQIPVADRQRLIAAQVEEARAAEEEEDRAAAAAEVAGVAPDMPSAEDDDRPPEPAGGAEDGGSEDRAPHEAEAHFQPDEPTENGHDHHEAGAPDDVQSDRAQPALIATETLVAPHADDAPAEDRSDRHAEPAHAADHAPAGEPEPHHAPHAETDHAPHAETVHDAAPATHAETIVEPVPDMPPPETVGGDADTGEDARDRRIPPRFLRNYKIQEVIKRRQILLIQVVKEERGSKGAALTTYLSLAGRYCVLMPNSPRGGGISRKITSAADRRRLKEITSELDIPGGMGLIVRTAGANRPKPEIRRDCEYLLRLWDDIREHTMQSTAPALIYEEASLIKRAIRDVYSRDIDEIQVEGEEGWRAARSFMNMLMPSHARKVQLYKDAEEAGGGGLPLFAKHGVDAQLDAMLVPTVQLKSGGYLVINQTEALVAIDVNSGRSTRERNIEETALRTNLEASDEVARQLRLRDLAGLIVIDFIDMESKKHNAMVERRLKEALKDDRARIQVGHISHFGLMEMSRQRLRPSLAETTFVQCAHCGGLGHVRSTESASIHVLRAIEEEGARRRAAEIVVHVAPSIAMYLLNHKRDRLGAIERRHAMHVIFSGDPDLLPPQLRIDRIRPQVAREDAVPVAMRVEHPPEEFHDTAGAADEEADDVFEPEDPPAAAEAGGEARNGEARSGEVRNGETEGDGRRRRRRRRRGGRREGADETGAAARPDQPQHEAATGDAEPHAVGEPESVEGDEDGADDGEGVPGQDQQEAAPGEAPRRRRSRRGGRRRRRDDAPGADGALPPVALPGAEQPETVPVHAYQGPTPADPFGGGAFDIFDVLEEAEARASLPVVQPAPARPAPPQEPVVRHVPLNEGAPPETNDEDRPVSLDSVVPHAVVPHRDPVAEPEVHAASDMESHPAPSAEPEARHDAEHEAQHAEEPAEPSAEHSGERADQQAVEQAGEQEEPAPLYRPVLVGAETPPAERKRGWWRR